MAPCVARCATLRRPHCLRFLLRLPRRLRRSNAAASLVRASVAPLVPLPAGRRPLPFLPPCPLRLCLASLFGAMLLLGRGRGGLVWPASVGFAALASLVRLLRSRCRRRARAVRGVRFQARRRILRRRSASSAHGRRSRHDGASVLASPEVDPTFSLQSPLDLARLSLKRVSVGGPTLNASQRVVTRLERVNILRHSGNCRKAYDALKPFLSALKGLCRVVWLPFALASAGKGSCTALLPRGLSL